MFVRSVSAHQRVYRHYALLYVFVSLSLPPSCLYRDPKSQGSGGRRLDLRRPFPVQYTDESGLELGPGLIPPHLRSRKPADLSSVQDEKWYEEDSVFCSWIVFSCSRENHELIHLDQMFQRQGERAPRGEGPRTCEIFGRCFTPSRSDLGGNPNDGSMETERNERVRKSTRSFRLARTPGRPPQSDGRLSRTVQCFPSSLPP